jgi:hypothetical protein
MDLLDKIPWWALLIRAPLSTARAMVAAALTRLEHEHRIDPEYYALDTHLFVEGSGEWTGMFHFVKLLDTTLADTLRESGLEVEVVWYTDRPLVWRWVDNDWDYTEDYGFTHARMRGVVRPQRAIRPSNPSHDAALLEGADLTTIRTLVKDSDVAYQAERGVVVFADARRVEHNLYTRAYTVRWYPKTEKFVCSVQENENVSVYTWPVIGDTGLDALSDIEGETEPKRILARLGIPEDALFPPDTD